MNMKSHFMIFAWLVFSINLFAQTDNSISLVKQEASFKALSFLNLIPEGRENEYGFDSRSDFSKIQIEEPYQTYYVSVDHDKLSFIGGGEWRVPLSVNNLFVALLTVQLEDGKAEAVDFGGNLLAQKLQEFENQYLGGGEKLVMIRNTFLNHDYVTTNFSSLCKQANAGGHIPVNVQSTQTIFQLNEASPKVTSMAAFCKETVDFAKNTIEK